MPFFSRKRKQVSPQQVELREFLDSIGGIPENNKTSRAISAALQSKFSPLSIEQIISELKRECSKRPNGRALKLLGFAYFHGGYLEKAKNVLQQSLKRSGEDPVAIYEILGHIAVLQGNWYEARNWFSKSYRFDFEFYLRTFGKEFLYVLAKGEQQRRPPIFGGEVTEFAQVVYNLYVGATMLHPQKLSEPTTPLMLMSIFGTSDVQAVKNQIKGANVVVIDFL